MILDFPESTNKLETSPGAYPQNPYVIRHPCLLNCQTWYGFIVKVNKPYVNGLGMSVGCFVLPLYCLCIVLKES